MPIAEDQFLFVKIIGWKQQPMITNKDYSDRLREVSERLTEKQAKINYDQFIYSVMKGKTIDFSPKMFLQKSIKS